jgi:hypothetical protein
MDEHPEDISNTMRVIASYSSFAYYYAEDILKAPWHMSNIDIEYIRLAEYTIALDGAYAYEYAENILKQAWYETDRPYRNTAERIIANDVNFVHRYLEDMLIPRLPDSMNVILSHAGFAYYYARDIIQGRWPEGEDVIYNKLIEHKIFETNITGMYDVI